MLTMAFSMSLPRGIALLGQRLQVVVSTARVCLTFRLRPLSVNLVNSRIRLQEMRMFRPSPGLTSGFRVSQFEVPGELQPLFGTSMSDLGHIRRSMLWHPLGEPTPSFSFHRLSAQ